MKLEHGKFYRHSEGRAIAVLDAVETYAWGPVFIVEETDHTGSAISCVGVETEDHHDRWAEISKEEFLSVLRGAPRKEKDA